MHRVYNHISKVTDVFWNSKAYFPVVFLITVLFLTLKSYVEGAMALIFLSGWMLLFCSEFMAAVSPFLCIFILSAPMYDNLNDFTRCIPIGMVYAAALVLRLLSDFKPVRVGNSAVGMALVSAAAALGGTGYVRTHHLPAALTVYYVVGLGIGAFASYVLFRSQLAEMSKKKLIRKMSFTFLTMGLSMCVCIFLSYIWKWDAFLEDGLQYLKYRNFAAVILVMTIPMIFFIARHCKWTLLLTVPYTTAMVMCGSRSALLFGMIMMAMCCIYSVKYKICPAWLMCVIVALAMIVVFVFDTDWFKDFYALRISEGLSNDENRMAMIKRAIKDFIRNPIFGVGLSNTANCDLAEGVEGSMFFYHNAFAQVVGSMGILGLAAYGKLVFDRVRFFIRYKSAFTSATALCYAGILMISMTNPGIFCPFPNTFMVALAFGVLEIASEDDREIIFEHGHLIRCQAGRKHMMP